MVAGADELAAAWDYHRTGQWAEAVDCCRRLLVCEAGNAEALHLLGVIAHQSGRSEQAIAYFQQAIRLQPSAFAFHNNLGAAHNALGQIAAATECFLEAVRLQPDCAEAQSNLGNALRSSGRLEEALAPLQATVRLRPGSAEAHRDLGYAFHQLEKLTEALEQYELALARRPDLPQVHNNIAGILRQRGDRARALAHLEHAVRLDARLAQAHHHRGLILGDQGDPVLAEECFRRAVALQPDSAEFHNDLGNSLWLQGRLDEAVCSYREALRLQPAHPAALNNLGNVFQDSGRIEEAEALFREALRREPGLTAAHSNLLRCMALDPAVSAAMLFEEHRRWARQHADPLGAEALPHLNVPDPDRRLRIGYVSPDFREHAVARLIEPVLAAHDHASFEIHCYALGNATDGVTRRLRRYADRWSELAACTDGEAAARIRRDGIDILVDLAGHTAGSRLLIFARKPAPVQVAHFGYGHTTGLSTMDRRMTDAYADPPGLTEALHVEGLTRLPQTAWCYGPTSGPSVNPLPALSAGRVTFASLSYPGKVNARVVELWSRVLEAVPGSRLRLLSGAAQPDDARPPGFIPPAAAHIAGLFASRGIAPDRLEFLGRMSRPAYLQAYQAADVGLDTSPYCGCVTTCDALWMGVPVISLAHGPLGSRHAVSILSNVGLEDWIADSPEDFVSIAVRWTRDLTRLAVLRSELRHRFLSSPLADGPALTRNLEAAYRALWREWCAR